METLSANFERRAASDYNATLLGNLAVILQAHRDEPYEMYGNEVGYATLARDDYSGRSDCVTLARDRGVGELTGFHHIDTDMLRGHGAGGLVVDVGAGQSTFLDPFLGSAETLAVDINSGNLEFQAARGHGTLRELAAEMVSIETGSVDVGNAAYSAPYWSVSEPDARLTAVEFARVLKAGGIALVGPIAYHEQLLGYETLVSYATRGVRVRLPEMELAVKYRSYVRTAFADEVTKMKDLGLVEVVATRSDPYRRAPVPMDVERRVPNFLMIRKLG
jgi:hypothetical protein